MVNSVKLRVEQTVSESLNAWDKLSFSLEKQHVKFWKLRTVLDWMLQKNYVKFWTFRVMLNLMLEKQCVKFWTLRTTLNLMLLQEYVKYYVPFLKLMLLLTLMLEKLRSFRLQRRAFIITAINWWPSDYQLLTYMRANGRTTERYQ